MRWFHTLLAERKRFGELFALKFSIWDIMVLQNLMRGEPEREDWLGEVQGFIPRGSGAVHLVSEQQHIKLPLVICVSSSGRCQGFLGWYTQVLDDCFCYPSQKCFFPAKSPLK